MQQRRPGVPVLEAAGDDRGLGRAWFVIAHVKGGFRCEYGAMEESSARAAAHYRRAGWSPSSALDNLGNALFYGPKPVEDAIAQCEHLLAEHEEDRASEANIVVWRGGLEAMRANFDEARDSVARKGTRVRAAVVARPVSRVRLVTTTADPGVPGRSGCTCVGSPASSRTTSTRRSASLAWSMPDNGGSAITAYKIYRGVGTGPDVLIATVSGDTNAYTDNSGSASFYYAVQAINANGAGALSPRVNPTPLETPCVVPGITVAKDPGDNAPNTPAVPQVNLQSVSIAEPYSGGAQKLIFTIKLASGGTLPANSQWYVIWDRPKPDDNYSRDYAAMKTDVLGTASFEYGRINYPLQYTSPAPNQGNLPTRLGNADAGT